MAFTLGIDYGTNSVRALLVDVSNGRGLASCVVDYPSGKQGILLDPRDANLARQHPGDYLFGLQNSVGGALEQASKDQAFSADHVIGIGVDTTGSSPLPVDERNVPLGLHEKWKDDLAAQCWLWKDHTSYREAARITDLAAKHRPSYIAKCGNTYSSEWWWSKIWRCLKVAPEAFEAAYSWTELADYIPAVLAGVTNPREIKRGVCAAGHKAFYSEEWGGLPDKEFLSLLDPKLADLRDRLYEKAYDAALRTRRVEVPARFQDRLRSVDLRRWRSSHQLQLLCHGRAYGGSRRDRRRGVGGDRRQDRVARFQTGSPSERNLLPPRSRPVWRTIEKIGRRSLRRSSVSRGSHRS